MHLLSWLQALVDAVLRTMAFVKGLVSNGRDLPSGAPSAALVLQQDEETGRFAVRLVVG